MGIEFYISISISGFEIDRDMDIWKKSGFGSKHYRNSDPAEEETVIQVRLWKSHEPGSGMKNDWYPDSAVEMIEIRTR